MLRPYRQEDESMLTELQKRDDVKKYIGSLRNSETVRRYWIIEIDNGTAVGVISLTDSDASDEGDSELVCAILAKYESHGIGTEACKEALKLLRGDDSVGRVIACVNRENEPSLKLIQKLGGNFLKHRDMSPWGDEDIYVLFPKADMPNA